eukprot:CAMPEP_0179003288 /NCGR_PEP_ID=MMETSP0795-20121207/12576_1 /TAXON_ID=88552 /ORGANISM="Amoebophrya sp., Strain Ameob2" /LENGTH=844 /DNA_ID=CAMNT_0020697243 /DNA_START=200 /DNA_END=2734 /DNA_ORIENTATION=+
MWFSASSPGPPPPQAEQQHQTPPQQPFGARKVEPEENGAASHHDPPSRGQGPAFPTSVFASLLPSSTSSAAAAPATDGPDSLNDILNDDDITAMAAHAQQIHRPTSDELDAGNYVSSWSPGGQAQDHGAAHDTNSSSSTHLWELFTSLFSVLASRRHGAQDFFSFLDPSVMWRLREKHAAAYAKQFSNAAVLREKALLVEVLIAAIYTRAVYGVPMYEGYVDSAATWVAGAVQKMNVDPVENEILNQQAFLALTGNAGAILVSAFTEEVYEPAFVLSVNHKLKCLVLSIRGSMAWNDVVTDIAAEEVDYCVYVPSPPAPSGESTDAKKHKKRSQLRQHEAASSGAPPDSTHPGALSPFSAAFGEAAAGTRTSAAEGVGSEAPSRPRSSSSGELSAKSYGNVSEIDYVGTEYVGITKHRESGTISLTPNSSFSSSNVEHAHQGPSTRSHPFPKPKNRRRNSDEQTVDHAPDGKIEGSARNSQSQKEQPPTAAARRPTQIPSPERRVYTDEIATADGLLTTVTTSEADEPFFIDQNDPDEELTEERLLFRTHKGFVRSADFVYRRIKNWVDRFLRKNPDYRFLFTGHSLGAATASLVYFKFPEIRDKKLITFGCPALVQEQTGGSGEKARRQGKKREPAVGEEGRSTSSSGSGSGASSTPSKRKEEDINDKEGPLLRRTPPSTSHHLPVSEDPRILGVVRGKDFVSALSMESFDRLADEISETSYFTQAVDWMSTTLFGQERPVRDYSKIPRPPGRFCLHLQVRPSTAAPVCYWTQNKGENYRRILLGLRMIDDHLPNLYLASLCDLYFNKFFSRADISNEEYAFLKMLKRIKFDYIQAYEAARWM